MWLCTKLGFFSIVQKDPDTFHIRARCRKDLDELAAAAGQGEPVKSYTGSDYPWRILCKYSDLPAFMRALTHSIDYGKLTRSHLMFVSPSGQRAAVCLGSRHSPRLKSAIAQTPTQRVKLAAYHDIQHRMVEWQHDHPAP